MTDGKVEDDLSAYEYAGMLERWNEFGRVYGFWRSWGRHQRIREGVLRKTPIPPSVRNFQSLFAFYKENEDKRLLAASCRDLPRLAASRARIPKTKTTSDPEGGMGGATPEVVALWNYWRERMKKNGNTDFCDERVKSLTQAIAIYGVDFCRKAIDGCRADPWHREHKVNDVTYIFRDAKTTERLADLAPSNGNGHSQPKPDLVRDEMAAKQKAGTDALTAEFAAKRAAGPV